METETKKERGERVVRALTARHFAAAYFDTAKEAVAAALSLIPAGASVTFGGSCTIHDTGLVDALKQNGRNVFDRREVPPEERTAFMKAHYFSDWFLASCNALDEDGCLYNMDGTGNRVASLTFGPENVLLFVSMKKVERDRESAVRRLREVASPRNAQRFDIRTPCKRTGNCANCKSPDSICCTFQIMRLSRPAGRTRVFLIGEDYGY